MEKNEIVLDDYSEENEAPTAVVSSNIDLDSLSDVPESERYFKILPTMNIPKTMTISEVKIGKPAKVDRDGKDLVETNGKGNKYYKGRLEIRFKEQIDGMKIRDFISGLYWSVNKETNEISSLPSIPRAGDINDKFTSDLAKMRTMFCNYKHLDSKDVSDKQFLKGMVGAKVSVEKESGKNPKTGTTYTKLRILSFVD